MARMKVSELRALRDQLRTIQGDLDRIANELRDLNQRRAGDLAEFACNESIEEVIDIIADRLGE